MKLLIIVPAFNEEKIIGKVLSDLKKEKLKNIKKEIIVINDGSTDKTEIEARKKNVHVISHHLNRGLGGALGTGFEYARRKKADIVVTFDADGQHRSKDIAKIIKPVMSNKIDVVIGSRLIKSSGMPIDRVVLNFFANLLNLILWSVWITDTQSGLRAFSKKALKKIQIKMDRMEVSSEFLSEIKRHKLSFKEVPIKALYTDYSRTKGQKNANSLSILVKLLLYKFEGKSK